MKDIATALSEGITELRTLVKTRAYWLRLGTGAVLLGIGLLATVYANVYLHLFSPDVSEAIDFFLSLFPTVYTFGLLVWMPPVFTLLFLLYIQSQPKTLPYIIEQVGLFWLVRAGFIILTPIGRHPDQIIPQGEGMLTTLAYMNHDYFFSGHTGLPFLMSLIVWQKPRLRFLFLFFSLLMGLCVLLEHTHYSIDVAAAPFITFATYRLGQKLFSSHLPDSV